MQKALPPVNSSENDCFADDAVEEAEETDTPLSSVSTGGRPLRNLRFADDTDLLGAVKKYCNNSLKDGMNTTWKSAPTRAKL